MLLKKFFKRLLIKVNRFCGYEIIDQNEFSFPSLGNKKYSDLNIINEKSIVVPLGEVKITRKVKSLGIIVRTNSNIHISDQNKKRIFNKDKLDYIEKSLKSLIVSINSFNQKLKNFTINLFLYFYKKIWKRNDYGKINLKNNFISFLFNHFWL